MIEIKSKDMCSGCHACYNICPKQAITMVEDENGFRYPKIDREKCIDCGLCEKICPILNIKNVKNEPEAYAVINNNEEIRLNSSSGGVFNLLANYILSENGVVFGAAYDDKLMVQHIAITNKDDICKLMKSKYVQSIIGNTYKECKEYLDEGRKVLFTGTPCQIEGLISYLRKDYDNLYTQDIICHGVPSPKIWQMYLEFLNKKFKQFPVETNFRKKDLGWELYEISVLYPNTSYECIYKKDPYMKAFLWNYSLRESCYNCKFKKYNRLSDITLGDFWGINNIDKEMNDNKGTSLIIVNTNKGKELLDKIKKECKIKKVDMDTAIEYNYAFNNSVDKPKNRNKFLKEINENNFEKVVEKYTKESFLYKVLRRIKKCIKKYL